MTGSSLLTVVGDLVEDIVVWTDTMRRGTDNPATVQRTRGGSAANVAACAARHVATRFIGCVGADSAGDVLAGQLASLGVDVRLQRRGVTGAVVVVVESGGERTMFPDRAAAATLEDIDETWLEGTSVLHLPAYGLQTPSGESALLRAASTVTAHGGKVTVDVSAVSVVEQLGVHRLDGLLARLSPTVVFANSDEAAALDLLAAPPPPGRVHVVKHGGRPTAVAGDGRVDEIPVPPVTGVRDTTGAGDAFAAGFLASWMRGVDAAGAAAAGHAIAAEILSTPGAGRSIDAPQEEPPCTNA